MSAEAVALRFTVPGERVPAWSALLLAVLGVAGFAWSGGHLVAAWVPSVDVDAGRAVSPGDAALAQDRGAVPVAGSAVLPIAASTPAAASTPVAPTTPAAVPEPSDCPPLFSVRFGRTSSDAIDLGAAEIAALVGWLDRHPDSALVIQGHADAVGKARFNFALSHRRARAVARRFAAAGLPKRRIVVQAVGEFQPRVDGDLADNRRVVLRATRAEGCRGAFTPEDDR